MRLWPLLATTLALAGCMGVPEPAPAVSPEVAETEAPVPSWSLPLSACHEAGSVAAYPMEGRIASSRVPEPWVLADIRAELGDPTLGSLGEPMPGAVTGHWHMAFVCDETWLGYVGVAVEPPPFDVGGAQRHMLLSGLAFRDAADREAIGATSGFVPNEAVRAVADQPAHDVLATLLEDAHKGTYEGYGTVQERAWRSAHVVRWWVTVPEGDEHRPHAFDVAHTDGLRHAATGESTGVGCHTGTGMHGPQGGLCGQSVIVSYGSQAVDIRYRGPSDALVPHEWGH